MLIYKNKRDVQKCENNKRIKFMSLFKALSSANFFVFVKFDVQGNIQILDKRSSMQ